MSTKTTTGQVDDFTFIMTCIQNSPDGFPKPDYEKVATLTGAKSANACYHRLWGIKKNWGMTGSKKGPATPKTPKSSNGKRGRPPKAKKSSSDGGSDDELAGSPSKKAKTANGVKKALKQEATDGEGDVGGGNEELSHGEDAPVAGKDGENGVECAEEEA